MSGPGKHSMDNDAVILRGHLGGISLKINEQITALNLAALELRDAAEEILAIRTTDDKVNSAAGIMTNRVVEDIKRSVAQVIAIRAELERFRGSL